MRLALFHSPTLPAPPAPGEVVVIRLDGSAERTVLRQEARAAILGLARAWGHAEAALTETSNGPRLAHCGELALSLSYVDTHAWLAFGDVRHLGVDAMRRQAFPELAEVARLYLGSAVPKILTAPDPAHAFAEAWTRHEARCKCQGRPLREAISPDWPGLRTETTWEAGVALSVAWLP